MIVEEMTVVLSKARSISDLRQHQAFKQHYQLYVVVFFQSFQALLHLCLSSFQFLLLSIAFLDLEPLRIHVIYIYYFNLVKGGICYGPGSDFTVPTLRFWLRPGIHPKRENSVLQPRHHNRSLATQALCLTVSHSRCLTVSYSRCLTVSHST